VLTNNGAFNCNVLSDTPLSVPSDDCLKDFNGLIFQSFNECENMECNESVQPTVETPNSTPEYVNVCDPYKDLEYFCKVNSKRITFSHLNINSLSNKHFEVHEILKRGFSDIFFLSETKIDSSYPNAQFSIEGFSIHRQDRNAHGGGLLCYVRQNLPHRYRQNIAYN